MTEHQPVEPCAIVQADGWDGAMPAFERVLASWLGGELPARVGDTRASDRWLAVRIAPRRFWFIGDARSPILPSIDHDLGSLVTLGESRLRFRLKGPLDMLAACVAVDWQAEEARPGRAIQTSLHHVPVLLLRTAADACDLLVPRTFAESLADWLAEVVAPYQRATV